MNSERMHFECTLRECIYSTRWGYTFRLHDVVVVLFEWAMGIVNHGEEESLWNTLWNQHVF